MNAPLVNIDTRLTNARVTLGGLRLCVYTDMDQVKSVWTSLENEAVSTVYQSSVWCHAWMQRVGKSRGILPVIVVGKNIYGKPMFLLPFQARWKAGVHIIEALTAPQGAYCFGIFDKAFIANNADLWFEMYFSNVIAALPPHDVLRLADLPKMVGDYRNPLLRVQNFYAANNSHIMNLPQDYQALLEQKRSTESRRSIRKRDKKLQAAGKLVFDLPATQSERNTTIVTMLAQQKARLAEIGVHNVFSELEQKFIIDLAQAQSPEGQFLRPYRLMLDGEIVAVMLGAYQYGTYWALISSLAAGEVRKHSPGDYALRAMIKALCEDGSHTLDFSAGDTAYKEHWSDREIPLYFILRASSYKGLAVAVAMLVREKLKRVAKQTRFLNNLLFNLRRIVLGTKARA